MESKSFCVSTDKAANPINMMGASKRIMEMFLMRKSLEIDISTAVTNVAFSMVHYYMDLTKGLKKDSRLQHLTI